MRGPRTQSPANTEWLIQNATQDDIRVGKHATDAEFAFVRTSGGHILGGAVIAGTFLEWDGTLLPGANDLKLYVTDAEDGIGSDHAVWAMARIQ